MTYKTCTECGVSLHVSYFGKRRDRPNGDGLQSCCKACKRERCRRWSAHKRMRPQTQPLIGPAPQVAALLASVAQSLPPTVLGLRVFRLPNGRVSYRADSRALPRDAEFIGVYDFDATPAMIAEDLAA